MDENKYRFLTHRGSAKQRGIPFLLTFKEWMLIWKASGHFHERGCKTGQFVMSRKGDIGAYEVVNVEIVTERENKKRARPLQRYGIAAKRAISLRHSGEGNPNSKLTRVIVARIRRQRNPNATLLARRYGVTFEAIRNIITRKSWV